MTPEQFAEKMKWIVDNYGDDVETCHVLMDDLMAATLESLGYAEGVKCYKNAEKWYG